MTKISSVARKMALVRFVVRKFIQAFLVLAIMLLALSSLAWLATPTPTTTWLNEDMAKRAMWQLVVPLGVSTNRHGIELGFRSDGVVVWRKR
jgi:Na+/H+-dicarboxylate symporter